MTTLSTKNKNKTSKPPRPYTEYNIFFQLEREYILQTLYLVVPIFDSKDAFDCSDVNYHGPPLPSKYSDLVLPKDWFVPGKARRRKRSHRKSHGKISFSDLSKKISSHWRNVNDETRLFCSQVSDISMMAYYKDRQTNHANESPVYTAKKSRGPNKPETDTNRHLGSPHITAIDSGSNVCFNPMDQHTDSSSSAVFFDAPNTMAHASVATIKCVDMEDEEIFHLWFLAWKRDVAERRMCAMCYHVAFLMLCEQWSNRNCSDEIKFVNNDVFGLSQYVFEVFLVFMDYYEWSWYNTILNANRAILHRIKLEYIIHSNTEVRRKENTPVL